MRAVRESVPEVYRHACGLAARRAAFLCTSALDTLYIVRQNRTDVLSALENGRAHCSAVQYSNYNGIKLQPSNPGPLHERGVTCTVTLLLDRTTSTSMNVLISTALRTVMAIS